MNGHERERRGSFEKHFGSVCSEEMGREKKGGDLWLGGGRRGDIKRGYVDDEALDCRHVDGRD